MASEAPIDSAPDSAVAAVVTPPERADEIFLEGPNSRFAEFWTLLRVMRDFLRGYRALHFVGPCVTVFGSARIKPGDPHYELALKMGAAIARLGFTVMTGGGPGIMEAANRGARKSAAARLDAISSCHSSKYRTCISIVVSGCIIFSFAKHC
jgi:hypothetical protein